MTLTAVIGNWTRGKGARSAIFLGVAAALTGQPLAAIAATPLQVETAINRGRDFLISTQQKNGSWEIVAKPDPTIVNKVTGGQYGGLTALAMLALLSSGVSPSDPHIKAAANFLASVPMKGDYALGIRAQVWALLPQDQMVRRAESADLNLLLRGLRVRAKERDCLYPYVCDAPPDSQGDRSVSQFDVLGMWAMAQEGVEVPSEYWRQIETAWDKQQQPDGSWAYLAAPWPGDNWNITTISMTAAAVATLFITQEYTHPGARCEGNVADPVIDKGMKYLGDNLEAGNLRNLWYTLFGISRVGLASGYKRLGNIDWFQWGAAKLLADQHPDGSFGWNDPNAAGTIDYTTSDTGFGLLFLTRGRAPVMMNKLQYSSTAAGGSNWNQRPRDVANLARWVGKQIESPLNWQIVTLSGPNADLHDAPILYIAGSKALTLSADDENKLRAFVEEGGMVIGHADCASIDFAKGFHTLGQKLFPGRTFRVLEPSSPIYTDETFPAKKWATKPAVEALTNGTRELMVLLPSGDPARIWQTQSFLSATRDINGQLMIDLLVYAVDKSGLRRRGETYTVDRDNNIVNPVKTIKMARLKYAGAWDPEPGGWRRLANLQHNTAKVEVTIDTVDLAAGGKLDNSYAMVSLTFDAADAQLTEPVRAAIRAYVAGGGTLLIDVAGGRPLYRTAAEAEIAHLFPTAPHSLDVLLPATPLFTADPALNVSNVSYRQFLRPSGISHAPQLRGFSVGNRLAVFYSPEDVSVGLVGMPIGGVTGYVPDDATKLVAAVLNYAAAPK